MILAELSGYLALHRRASLADMALRLRCEPEAVADMLAVLERKGRVRRIDPVGPGAGGGCGGSCGCCAGAPPEVYEWTGPDRATE